MTENVENYAIKRRYKRRTLACRAGILLDGKYVFADALEISEGGILLKVGKTPAIGTQVEIQFIVPSGYFLVLKAEVAYVLKAQGSFQRVGFRFLDLGQRDRTILNKYITL